jgi:hypothetical protein
MRFCLGPQVLGDIYPEIEDESLLVSDLVPVDHKVRLCTEVLPGLLEQVSRGGDAGSWLDDQLRPFGEDPRGMVQTAALTWLDRAAGEGRAKPDVCARAAELFRA